MPRAESGKLQYNLRRFAQVSGLLLSGSLLFGLEYLDRPTLAKNETDVTAEIDSNRRVTSLGVKVPIEDRLFSDRIDFVINGTLKGEKVSLPYKVTKDLKDNVYSVKFKPEADDITVEVFNNEESLGYIPIDLKIKKEDE